MMIWKGSNVELSRWIYHLKWQLLKVKIQGNLLMENFKNRLWNNNHYCKTSCYKGAWLPSMNKNYDKIFWTYEQLFHHHKGPHKVKYLKLKPRKHNLQHENYHHYWDAPNSTLNLVLKTAYIIDHGHARNKIK